jgi:hypothetical protein
VQITGPTEVIEKYSEIAGYILVPEKWEDIELPVHLILSERVTVTAAAPIPLPLQVKVAKKAR